MLYLVKVLHRWSLTISVAFIGVGLTSPLHIEETNHNLHGLGCVQL